jgi:Domain of unknown function (DUF4436)
MIAMSGRATLLDSYSGTVKNMEKHKVKRMGRAGLIFIGCVVLLFLLALAVIAGFARENTSRQVVYFENKPKANGYLVVLARVISSDLNKKSLVVRIIAQPQGDLGVGTMHLLAGPLTLYVTPTASQNPNYQSGSLIPPMDISLDTAGEVEMYPWDSHEANLEIYAVRPGAGGQQVPVPVQLIFQGSEPGLRLKLDVTKEQANSHQMLTIFATRSTIIRVVVLFAIVIIWFLAATVAIIAILVLRGRGLQIGMLTFAAALLFSMIAFRNAMPGAPPIGALMDYIGAFWGYTIVTLSLIAFTIVWIRHGAD